jgi:hypothetical protein
MRVRQGRLVRVREIVSKEKRTFGLQAVEVSRTEDESEISGRVVLRSVPLQV